MAGGCVFDVKVGSIWMLKNKRYLYYRNFITGFDSIYPKPFEDIVNKNLFDKFNTKELPRIHDFRNKILHGQPTGKSLSAKDLTNEIDIIKNWCNNVAEAMMKEIGYDGFERNSFRKNLNCDMAKSYKLKISDSKELDTFIESYMK